MAGVANINDVLEGHVALELECVDRLLLNAYVPGLQMPGQIVRFLCGHLKYPIPSTALLGQISNRFRAQTRRFVRDSGIPVLRLAAPDRGRWDDRKLDHVRPYLEAAEREGRFGVVALVVTEEFQRVWSARNRSRKPGVACLDFFFEKRRVGAYYFYILDPEFGPGFIKFCTYAPWTARIWLNGHEWAKRQALGGGLGFTELHNGFGSCSDPQRLQAICDSFAAEHVQAFFDRWITHIPTPLTDADRATGYWWELSMRQVELSRTLVLDDPRRARSFFEALVQDNVGIGRPEEVSMIFARQLRRPTQHRYQTRIFTTGTEIRIDFRYKHSRVKQYLKDGRALRIETVINRPDDLDAPSEDLGSLVAERPGEYVAIDTTRLDVFAIDPFTLQWVGLDLTAAIDVCTRSILAFRLTPFSTQGVDLALLHSDLLSPTPMDDRWPEDVPHPYCGVPENVVLRAFDLPEGTALAPPPTVRPGTVVIDRGRNYQSVVFMAACEQLRINVQSARPYRGPDNCWIERLFRTMRERLLESLPGYTGPNVLARGKDIEADRRGVFHPRVGGDHRSLGRA
jgi:hypothetical protein